MKLNNKLVIAYDENKEEKCIALDCFDNLLWKHYKIWWENFNRSTKLKQLEVLSKIQMENTKRYHYTIFAKVTPYFNENEFAKYLTELGVGKDSSWLSIIRWKGQKYNIILSNGIAEYINKLKNDLHISSNKIEINIFENGEIDVKKQFERPIPIKLIDTEKNQENKKKNAIDKIDWKDVFELIHNINDCWKLEIPEIGTIKINISTKDYERIDYLTYVGKINQPSAYFNIKKKR